MTMSGPWIRRGGASIGALALLLLAAAGAPGQDVRPAPPAAELTHGWIGFSYLVLPREGRDGAAIVVRRVVEGSPAERAGLRPGDALLRIDGRDADPTTFRRVAGSIEAGDRVRLTIRRDDSTRDVLVVAAPRPRPAAGVRTLMEVDSVRRAILRRVDSVRLPGAPGSVRVLRPPSVDSIAPDTLHEVRVESAPLAPFIVGRRMVAGARLTEVNPTLGEYFGVESGVLVTRVFQETPAARAGLGPGDVITGVGEEPVTSLDDLRRLLWAAAPPAVLRIVREGDVLRRTLPR